MEENLEISKSLLLLMQSKFFLFLSLPLSEKKNRSTLLSLPPSLSLSLYVWGFSLSSKEGEFCAQQRERFYDLLKAFRLSL